MIIRTYRADDRLACIEIFKSNTPNFFGENELSDFELWLNGKDENILSYENTQEEYFYVLEHDGALTACGGMYLPKKEQCINLVWGMVHLSTHLHGFGSKLMQYRLDLANVLFPGFPITIDTTQYSFGFFKKFNFETVKMTENFYAPELHRIDMIKINE